jgi:hypothetical protein
MEDLIEKYLGTKTKDIEVELDKSKKWKKQSDGTFKHAKTNPQFQIIVKGKDQPSNFTGGVQVVLLKGNQEVGKNYAYTPKEIDKVIKKFKPTMKKLKDKFDPKGWGSGGAF